VEIIKEMGIKLKIIKVGIFFENLIKKNKQNQKKCFHRFLS